MRSTLRRPMPALQIGYHDHCFDGVASAAAFLRFYRDKVKPGLTDVGLRGLAHRAGQLFDPDVFAGEENAVVDFRFSPDPRLTWWFDHHQSAFESASDEAVFHADRTGRKFWDPQAKSCTRFLPRVGEEKFGWDPSPLRELIDWAEIIDGAPFSTPQMAVLPVSLPRGTNRTKVPLGSNQWKQQLRRHNLAQIAERYGGGGHPAVAAISLPPDRLQEARAAAATIADELRKETA